eukprot:CAMPEP_0176007270 /NCGR_PEP_ID=MMETSP0120_2-20121206/3146_1 /TAXON_ID=160619 /ORGANISM="Kryptoperidinium foliaceum, Strain CCMP 1326" /LENGTH=198 /DNA_ID=CAMNT_0017340025 /DNA_START=70 /DNA_END=666 /DNA_ORIENTATION=-
MSESVDGATSLGEEEGSHAAGQTVGTEEDSHVEEERSMASGADHDYGDDDDDDEAEDEENENEGNHEKAKKSTPPRAEEPPSILGKNATKGDGSKPPTKKKKKAVPPTARRGRAPAVKGLTIPFRTVKKAMKLDPDIPIVQNEAAIMTTMAAELFLKSLAKESQQIAKNRGRNTIRYEDVAEARSNDPALSFLATLMP